MLLRAAVVELVVKVGMAVMGVMGYLAAMETAGTAGMAEMAGMVAAVAMLGIAWDCGLVGWLSLCLPTTQWPMVPLVQLVERVVVAKGAMVVMGALAIHLAVEDPPVALVQLARRVIPEP